MKNLYLTLDGEFSSLDKDGDLLTLYMAIYDEKYLLDSLDLELMPNNGRITIDPESMSINNIDLRGWAGIKYKDAGRLVDGFIRKYVFDDSNPKYPVRINNRLRVIGHGVLGDISKIKEFLISEGRWDDAVERVPIDTLTFAAILRDCGKLNLESISLETLTNYFEIKVQNLHTAKDDAKAIYELYWKLKELL